MAKIKILHILLSAGGVETYLRLLLNNLDPNKFTHVIIHGKEDTTTPFIDKDGHKTTEYRLDLQRNIQPFVDWVIYEKMKPIIKKEQPQLIHGHSAKGGVFARLLGKKYSIPALHTPHAYSFLSTNNTLKKKVFLKLERYFSKFNNKVLACSNSEKERALNDVGYLPHKVLVFNNAIEPVEGLPPLQLKKTWPDAYICSAGRPSYQKNIALMIEVIREIKKEKKDIHLVLMGGGLHSPNLKLIKDMIREYQLQDNITLLKWAHRNDVLNIVSQSQLYISTARYEGLPYSVIEAMALKKTAVVSAVDGNRDLIINNKNGYTIRQNDPQLYKEKIIDLLDNSATRQKFEAAIFKDFQTHFNIKNTIHQLAQIYALEAKQ